MSASTYRKLALVENDTEPPPELPTYVGGPELCPFCRCGRYQHGALWNERNFKSRWLADKGAVSERCKRCDGRWFVLPVQNP